MRRQMAGFKEPTQTKVEPFPHRDWHSLRNVHLARGIHPSRHAVATNGVVHLLLAGVACAMLSSLAAFVLNMSLLAIVAAYVVGGITGLMISAAFLLSGSNHYD